MTTVQEVITRSLRRINIAQAGEPLTSEDVADSLEAFNQLMHALKGEGADTRHANLELTDDVPVNPEHIRPLVVVLAADLAPEFERPEPPGTANALTVLRAAYAEIPTLEVDIGLTRNRIDKIGRYNIDNG